MKRIFLVLVCSVAFVQADELKPFTTDGCSAFLDGTPTEHSLWLDCCIQHDLAYWLGGTRDERHEADLALRQCVAENGEEEIAEIMLAGVRFGGSPYWPVGYRWGYGWSYLRGYEALNDNEIEKAHERLDEMRALLDRFDEQLSVPTANE